MYNENKTVTTRARIAELDFLKGVFITLMVIFHLTLIEKDYPLLRTAVYTFHMPAFLVISGYLANVNKSTFDFGRGLLRIFVPFVIFEIIYVLLLFYIGRMVGAKNAVEQLTPLSLLGYVFVNPRGPYWYLHTLVICSLAYYISFRILRFKMFSGLIATGVLLYLMSYICGLSWCNAWYFLIGVFFARCCGGNFTDIISRSWIAVVPLAFLFSSEDNLSRGTLAGIAITILVICLFLQLCASLPMGMRNFFMYLGRNSLSVVVFSPLLTVAMKPFVPLFSFDSTDICFAVFATSFTIGCSIAAAWISDKVKLSRYLFFKSSVYEKWNVC